MWLQGEVLERIDWHDSLFTLKIKAQIHSFEAGQFIKLSMMDDYKRIARAYSIVSSPAEDWVEVLVTRVDNGLLSNHLHQLNTGDSIQISEKAAGFLVLEEFPQARDLWLVASGSGVGPYVSMLRDGAIFSEYQRIIVLYTVRTKDDLAYAKEFDAWQNEHASFSWFPIVTREPGFTGLKERIPALLNNGSLEQAVGQEISGDVSHIVICGNPDLIQDLTDALKQRGLNKHRRRAAGHISTEKYW